MTGQDRVLAAIDGRPTDRLALMPITMTAPTRGVDPSAKPKGRAFHHHR